MLKVLKRTLPDQHGAWSVLVSALIIGTFAGGLPLRGDVVAVFWLTALGGFLFRYALGYLFKIWKRESAKDERFLVAIFTALYGGLFGTCGLFLILKFHLYVLLIPASVAGVLFVLTLFYELRRKHLTTGGEFTGMLALSTVLPSAYFVSHGFIDGEGWMITLIMISFYTGSVFHVRYLVRNRNFLNALLTTRVRKGAFSLIYHGASLIMVWLAAVYFSLSYLWILVYMPVFLRAYITVLMPRKPPEIKTIGLQELTHTFLLTLLVFIL